jgi:hypothetical protein
MSRWITGTLALLTLGTGAGALFLLVEQGLDPVTLMVAVVAVALGFGTLDRMRSRVTLRGDEIIIVRSFRRRRLFRGHVDAVRWTHAGIYLELDDGLEVRLPHLARGRDRAAVIRAWVERARRSE